MSTAAADNRLMAETHPLSSTSNRIAAVRTASPLVWAAAITAASEAGLDLSEDIAGALNVQEGYVQLFAPLVIAFALWLIGHRAPGLLQQVLMGFKVDGQAYERRGRIVAGALNVPSSHVVVVDPAGAHPAADAVDRIIETDPARADLDDARRRLADYLNGRAR